MADLNTYPEPSATFSGDAFLPDPPPNRPQPNYGPVPPAQQKAQKEDPYGENYEFWKQGLSPVKVSYTTQLILAVVVVTIVVTLVLIFA
nr:Uncharacterised protein [Streptococcus thermophilus]